MNTNLHLVKLALFIETIHGVRSLVAFYPKSRVLMRVYLGRVNCYQVVIYGSNGYGRLLQRATAFDTLADLDEVFQKYLRLESAAFMLLEPKQPKPKSR